MSTAVTQRPPAHAQVERIEPGSGEHAIAPPPRVRLFAQLDLHTDSNFYAGFSGDLADGGGVFIATYEPLSVGDRVWVELALPWGQFVSLQGTVAWLRQAQHRDVELAPGVGVELDALDQDVALAFQRFMAHREPIFVDPD